MGEKQEQKISLEKKDQASNLNASEKKSASKFSPAKLWRNKRTRGIVIGLGVVILAAVVYLVLSLTILKPAEEEEAPTVGPHGETLNNGRPFVMEPLESDQITGIRVENEFGGFNYYKGIDGKFYFEGAEAMLYDQTSAWMTTDYDDMDDLLDSVSMIDGLYGISRYMLASTEVVGYDADHLSSYGLDGDGCAKLTVTYEDLDGTEKQNVVLFGYETLSGGSYYVMLEGRPAVYVLADTTVTRCIFTDLKSYFTPLVAPYVPTASYPDVEHLRIDKHEEPFFEMRKLSDEEYEEIGKLFTHILTYPNEYYPSPENMEIMLEKFSGFSGESVVEYNISEKLSDPQYHDEMTKTFHLYSLLDQNNRWTYTLYYEYKELDFNITLYLSEKLEIAGEEGEDPTYIYYVYSPDFDVIVEFLAEELPWVEWDLLDFIDNHAYATAIDNVSSITMTYSGTTARFNLTGEGKDLKITSPNVQSIDTDNFRQLYKAILFTTLEGYAEEPEDGTLLLSISVSFRDGTSHTYTYYGMTARKAYYSFDGAGEFYINRDYVKQMISACNGILAGEKVSVDRRN